MQSFANRIKYAAVGLAVASTFAVASVTLEDDGTGWVGKGDVQTAFGWNNAAAQRYVNDVSFSFQQTSTYEADCEWFTGNPDSPKGQKRHEITLKRKAEIIAAVNYDARKTGQWTGYTLKGFGATTAEGEVPVVGGPCPGNAGNDGVWIAVEQTSSSPGELYVTFQGNSVLLPETPPPEPVLL